MAKKPDTAPTRRVVYANSSNVLEAAAAANLRVEWRPIYCAGYDDVQVGEKGGKPVYKRTYHHFSGKACDCKPGPQWRALEVVVDELALGGGRGSAKSEVGFGWLISGDAASKGDYYTNNKHYTALILRRSAKDLENWFKRAKAVFCPLGATAVESPSMKFRWPSGAEFILDHFQDESAYMKYQGQEFQRILIEEAPQIPKETWYEELRRCNRTTKPGMKASMMLTANPAGPGMRWFKNRFLKLPMPDGTKSKSGDIWRHPKTGETRCFIHSTVYDNPYLLVRGGDYRRKLEGLDDENERRRWLHGDFDALVGQYFTTFREEPLPGDPPNARHVVKPEEFQPKPWWPRICAMDIGYKHYAAVVKGALSPDGRLWIYDEMVEAEVEPEEWGFRIAKWLFQELRGLPNHSIPLFLSHEAFGPKSEGRSLAQQIENGIRKVLGQGATFVMPSDTAESDPDDADFFRRLSFQTDQARIVIRKPFSTKRVDGWMFMRGLMRFKQHATRDRTEFDPAYAQMLMSNEGIGKMMEYVREFDRNATEALPKLQIVGKNCPKVVQALQSVAYDENGKNPEDIKKTESIDDDVADATRYLCTGYRRVSERMMPRGEYMEQRMADLVRSGLPVWGAEEALMDEADDELAGAFFAGAGSSRTQGVRLM